MSLLTDAGHNASDVAGLLLSFFAFRLAKKKPTETFTYGYKKTTILAALANAVVLLVAIGMLGWESVARLRHPEPVAGNNIAWVAGAGILVNALSAFVFYRAGSKELNMRSAYLHLLTDALVSAGVVAGGIAISYTHWYWIDPAIGIIVMIVIISSTWQLLRDSFRMAADAVPPDISLTEVIEVMRGVKHVADVTHVHVWSLSTTEHALTAHILVRPELSFDEKMKVVQEVRHTLEHHSIQHSTLELETGQAATATCEL
jgi:cobalt-zinc-cadmium efflux system protein